MKILFCHNFPQVKELGAPKVLIELAEELELIGWECSTVGPEELGAECPNNKSKVIPYRELLRHYLQNHAFEYDVVDYDHRYLPYPRSDFNARTLLVARSVMLVHHIQAAHIPHTKKLLPNIKRIVINRRNQAEANNELNKATSTINQADLINVCNDDEKMTLNNLGVPEDKIVVLPFGISRDRRTAFDSVSSMPPETPVVGFVGTFDYRKGAAEFPIILEQVIKQVPNVQFRLLGTKGLFPTAESVFAQTPKHLRPYVQVVPTFRSHELPDLLASCSVGIFPSYIEGFGFGVLEMLAASIPVIAYDVPGPRMMLPSRKLVPVGDTTAMATKVIELLKTPTDLAAARIWAKEQSKNFEWRDVAAATDKIYRAASEDRVSDRRGMAQTAL